MNTSEDIEILKLVCHRLELAEIPYMLTGSLAANFYAVPRMTRDIDIVIEIQKLDTNRLFQIFHNDFYIDKDSIDEAITNQGIFNIIHNNSVFKVDFIVRKDEVYRSTEFRRRQCIQMGDIPIWIVAPEDLIISKLVWAKDSFSERQINDVRNLLGSIQNLDREYIHKWVQKLELSQIFEKVGIHE